MLVEAWAVSSSSIRASFLARAAGGTSRCRRRRSRIADRDRGAARRLARRHAPRARSIAINAANIGRTLPSLAVLALVMPMLGTGFRAVALRADAARAAADPDQHLHRDPAGRPRHRRCRARHGHDAHARSCARSSCRSRLPVIFAGIRTAAVQVVSGAVLAGVHRRRRPRRFHHRGHRDDGAAAARWSARFPATLLVASAPIACSAGCSGR